jgi:hypothetical protein
MDIITIWLIKSNQQNLLGYFHKIKRPNKFFFYLLQNH